MRTIALATQKGGAGKTTITASLAVAAAEAGERVAALDIDPQGSLMGWGDMREGEAVAVDRPTTDQLLQLPAILAALKQQGFTVVFLDTAGVEGSAGNLAMKAADLVLIPARPSSLDLKATMPTVETLMRLGMKSNFAFVLNQCPPGRNSRSSEAAKGLAMFGVLADPALTQRADHQDAIAAGQGVTEYAPDGKAAGELRSLWSWINHRTRKEA